MRERSAAIVLAGGRSTRMGRSKADLEWHGSTLLRRAVGIAGRAVDGPIVVVRAPGQPLPRLPVGVEVVDDEREGRGPLQGIASGIAALAGRSPVVAVSAVDMPHLHPAFVRHVVRSLRPGDDVALPRVGGFAQPLAAAYRVATLAPALRDELAHDRRGSAALLVRLRVRELDERALLADPDVAALDPGLDSVRNLNEPSEYDAARARPEPSITISSPADPRPRTAVAATLARAARAAGLAATAELAATLNGGHVVADPEEPLATGDAIAFESTRAAPASNP